MLEVTRHCQDNKGCLRVPCIFVSTRQLLDILVISCASDLKEHSQCVFGIRSWRVLYRRVISHQFHLRTGPSHIIPTLNHCCVRVIKLPSSSMWPATRKYAVGLSKITIVLPFLSPRFNSWLMLSILSMPPSDSIYSSTASIHCRHASKIPYVSFRIFQSIPRRLL